MTQADAILNYLRAHPNASTLDIANAIGVGRRQAIRGLHQLQESGIVRGGRDGEGARTPFRWWVVEVDAAPEQSDEIARTRKFVVDMDAEIVRTIATFAEAYAPDGPMPLVDYLSGTLDSMNRTIASLKARLAEERAQPDAVCFVAPPSIAGLPFPAALALIASAAGVDLDYADGWPTITPRVIGEIVRALSTVGSA